MNNISDTTLQLVIDNPNEWYDFNYQAEIFKIMYCDMTESFEIKGKSTDNTICLISIYGNIQGSWKYMQMQQCMFKLITDMFTPQPE